MPSTTAREHFLVGVSQNYILSKNVAPQVKLGNKHRFVDDEMAGRMTIVGVDVGIRTEAETQPLNAAPEDGPPPVLTISEGQRSFALHRFLQSIALLPIVVCSVWFLENFVTCRLMGIPFAREQGDMWAPEQVPAGCVPHGGSFPKIGVRLSCHTQHYPVDCIIQSHRRCTVHNMENISVGLVDSMWQYVRHPQKNIPIALHPGIPNKHTAGVRAGCERYWGVAIQSEGTVGVGAGVRVRTLLGCGHPVRGDGNTKRYEVIANRNFAICDLRLRIQDQGVANRY